MDRLDHLNRHAERGTTDRDRLDALLDEQWVGTLSTVVDGLPWAVPMLFARDGDRIILHGSTGAGALREVADGAPAAFCVATVDALVVAATTFDSSANYRSAVVRGRLANLTGDEKTRVLDAFSEKLLPGRTSEVRPMTKREMAATLAMALPIEDGAWIMKAREGLPSTNEESGAERDVWTGVVPVRSGYVEPAASPWSTRTEVPASVRRLVAGR
ncbi:pyridoxamine 5'-phosphate oxidase family protein [Agilicoccus flavus]|uniref:pyridoxamine 5'-phosphate oxidase family protein n=1 Tax=Agilicoccus flavus TaxID=2775968 RepID=UPI001CF66E27|nr:pyridoxamine 5'-phosphate oxidase family protein [Agilicoccus flavus]